MHSVGPRVTCALAKFLGLDCFRSRRSATYIYSSRRSMPILWRISGLLSDSSPNNRRGSPTRWLCWQSEANLSPLQELVAHMRFLLGAIFGVLIMALL